MFPELSHKLLITFKHLVKPHAITRGFDYHNKSNPNHLPSYNARGTKNGNLVESEATCRFEYLLEARISSRRQVRHPNKVQKDLYAAAWLPLFNRTRPPPLPSARSGAPIYIWKSSPLTLVNNRDPVTCEIKPW